MTTILSVTVLAVAALVPLAYWLGRRSAIEHALDRQLARELDVSRLNLQEQSDRAEDGR